ncbi:MAG: serine hydrolase [Gemmatimonadaceae bacterium]
MSRLLRQFAEQRIFAPLGMSSTHFHDDHTMIVPGRTSAYQPRPSGGWFISIPVFDTYGATSLFTTTGDLLTWLRQLDEPKVGSARLLHDAQTSAQLNDGTATGYGYGMSIGRYRGLRVVGHGGADAGYRAQIERYPERGIAVAVLCNVSTAGPGALARRVVDVLLGDSAPRETPAVDTTSATTSSRSRALWAGVYHDPVSHLPLRVRVAGDSMTLGDGRPLRLSSDTTAFVTGGGQGFVLHLRGGSVTGITQLPKGTRSIEYRRETLATLSKTQLAELAGTYESEELDVRYQLVVGDSGLTVHARRVEPFVLTALWTDAFAAPFGTVIEFTRDAARKVDGFTISDGRARGIRFARIVTDARR